MTVLGSNSSNYQKSKQLYSPRGESTMNLEEGRVIKLKTAYGKDYILSTLEWYL
ncbi:hypothetical protein NIES4071_87490 [Calothrix sp. NIES-4071]|nr:hypothetical protein NIES4071_87490 [Calothrix sp. NIES-4071]BAZ63016.1 hypothetical protein NIES4105_87420 [Calothrix sp. NIES-4105]